MTFTSSTPCKDKAEANLSQAGVEKAMEAATADAGYWRQATEQLHLEKEAYDSRSDGVERQNYNGRDLPLTEDVKQEDCDVSFQRFLPCLAPRSEPLMQQALKGL